MQWITNISQNFKYRDRDSEKSDNVSVQFITQWGKEINKIISSNNFINIQIAGY